MATYSPTHLKQLLNNPTLKPPPYIDYVESQVALVEPSSMVSNLQHSRIGYCAHSPKQCGMLPLHSLYLDRTLDWRPNII